MIMSQQRITYDGVMFLLLSLKSVCLIAIRALTGMQLISNEGKNAKVKNAWCFLLRF